MKLEHYTGQSLLQGAGFLADRHWTDTRQTLDRQGGQKGRGAYFTVKEKSEIKLKRILKFGKSCLIFWQPCTAGGYSQKWVGHHNGTPYLQKIHLGILGRYNGTPSKVFLHNISPTKVQNWEYLQNVRAPKNEGTYAFMHLYETPK